MSRILPLALLLAAAARPAAAQSLFEMQEGVETRWASGENPAGEKGAGGQAEELRSRFTCRVVDAREPIHQAHSIEGMMGEA